MKKPIRLLIPVCAAVLIAVSGALHAVQTGAWSGGERRTAAAVRLSRIPLNLGDWKGSEIAFDPRQMKAAEADGAVSRSYSHAAGGPAVSVMVLCGPHGPIAVHPPTVCFTSAGFRQATPAERHTVEDDEHRNLGTFWVSDFEKTVEGLPVRIRTYWAWSDGGAWAAPDHARFAFAGAPVLHKLYATRMVSGVDDASSGRFEVTDRFLRQLLPAVGRTAF